LGSRKEDDEAIGVKVLAERNNVSNGKCELREKGDDEIVRFLGLEDPVPWIQNLTYLRRLYAFNTSVAPVESPRPLFTEEEQRQAVRNRDKW